MPLGFGPTSRDLRSILASSRATLQFVHSPAEPVWFGFFRLTKHNWSVGPSRSIFVLKGLLVYRFKCPNDLRRSAIPLQDPISSREDRQQVLSS